MRSVKVPPTSTPSRFTPHPLGLEDDLSEVLAPLHHLHRLARLREREDLVHERDDLAGARELEARLDLAAQVAERSDHASLHAEEGDDVERHHLAGVRTADHHPPVLPEAVEP